MIYFDIQEFYQIKEYDERWVKALDMQAEYLNGPDSPNEINIDGNSFIKLSNNFK